MLREGPYTELYHRKDALLHIGHDYSLDLLRRTMSNRMFSSNATLVNFLVKVNALVVEWFESVKHIKTFANFAMDKYNKKVT